MAKKKLCRLPLAKEIINAVNWAEECLRHADKLNEYSKVELINFSRRLSEARVGAEFKWELVGLREVDRCSSILYGPNFCSDAHPWPSDSGLPMRPYIQLNLTECRRHFIMPSGISDGLVQVFMPQGKVLGRESFVRFILESECKRDAVIEYPVLTKKSDPSGIFQWDMAGTQIKQSSGFGTVRHFVDIYSSVQDLLDLENIADLTEQAQIDVEDLLDAAVQIDDLAAGETCLMGNFCSIQYELNEMKGEPLFCIGEGDWGVGNAQIFYELVDGEARFHFNWSC